MFNDQTACERGKTLTGTPEQRPAAPARGRAETASHAPVSKSTAVVGTALAAFGLWHAFTPYVGPEVVVTTTVEFVDHVVPAAIVLAMAIFSIRRGAFELLSAAVALLGGLWMTVTHIPLVTAASRGEASWDGAIWMSVPTASLLLLTALAFGLAWTAER